MTQNVATSRLQLGLAEWAAEAGLPSDDLPVGSVWIQEGSFPAIPVDLFLKTGATVAGWTRQNLTGLDVFNIRTFGAKGDGVADDRAAIVACIAACSAAGGGVVYIPPAQPGKFYLVGRVVSSAPHSIELNGVSNITFLGDGPSSKIAAVGSAAAGSWWIFYIHNGCHRLRFENFMVDGVGITNNSSNNDSHLFQLFSSTGTDTSSPSDVEFRGMFLGTSAGDGIAQKGETGLEILGTRVRYCMHDSVTVPFRSRSFVNSQRFVRRVQISYNWATNAKSEIHQEPSGGSGTDITSPEEWIIVGNVLVHTNPGPEAIAIEGVGLTLAKQSLRSVAASNIIVDGIIYCTEIKQWSLERNCITYGGADVADVEGVIHLFEAAEGVSIAGNVLACTAASLRPAVHAESNGGFFATQIEIADNICRSTFNDTGDSITLSDANETTCDGNVVVMDTSSAGTGSGIAFITIATDIDHAGMVGNLVVAPNQPLLSLGRFAANSGRTFHNALAACNLADNANNGIRFEKATTETFVDWRGALHNNVGGVTASLIAVQAGGATLEGLAGPGAQICMVNAAAGPEGAVVSPVGSLCTNIAGTAGGVLFVKDRGAGVSGGSTGYMRVAASLLEFGCASATTTATALFLAPGGADLATANTTPIQMTATRIGTLRTMRLACVAGTGAQNVTYTVQKNGVDTSLAMTASNTATSGTGNGATVNCAAGDAIGIKVTKAGAISVGQSRVQVTVEYAQGQ